MPRKFHGPELKCGGPQMCPDCRERVKQAKEYGIENPFAEWITQKDKDQAIELLKILDQKKTPKVEE